MRLTDEERRQYREDGYVVRERAFAPADVDAMRTAAEDLCRDLAALHGSKVKVSAHYVFETAPMRDAVVKWEPLDGHDVVQGVEPFAHLHPVFMDYAEYPALVAPSADILGLPEVALFTEKLNVKRARVGGRYALHQDYPYWVDAADDPDELVTAWLALDDATAENGPLEVLPGSHKLGRVPGKESDLPFERNEIDEATFDTSGMVAVEVPAGGVVLFGPYLVHRSRPNRSAVDRRAVLYTYQRKGSRTQRDNVRARVEVESRSAWSAVSGP